eukprot:GHVU01093122.1.p1 GENE.GHVU01093122.1~~GHVU01093122.1.p1  ORF type:complete len:101 (-),score=1.51 GHVU01093122.1:54-356(-)
MRVRGWVRVSTCVLVCVCVCVCVLCLAWRRGCEFAQTKGRIDEIDRVCSVGLPRVDECYRVRDLSDSTTLRLFPRLAATSGFIRRRRYREVDIYIYIYVY